MKHTISITVLPGEEKNTSILRKKASEHLNISEKDITGCIIQKKSIDARKGKLRIHLACTVWVGETPPEEDTSFWTPQWKQADPSRRVVIVGSGPAGLFAALRLLEEGITPVIVERGAPLSDRKQKIPDIAQDQQICPESNYCFGEGGGVPFSGGKLYTRSNKKSDPSRILAIFHHHGAQKEILTDAQPQIDTNLLPNMIEAMKETIVSHGGEIHFYTRCVDLVEDEGHIKGILAKSSLAENNPGYVANREILGDSVILAGGQSSRDLYKMISSLRPEGALEAKTFAAGVRIEHSRETIDRIQYHGREQETSLPPASYRLSTQVQERGVYSFSMCPGGQIIPSATSDNEIVVNGLTPSNEVSQWTNSAIVVEIRPEDIPAEFSSKDKSVDPLAGIHFQESMEKEAKKQGDGQRAPAQRLEDYLAGRDSSSLPECSYLPGITPSRLDRWLPVHLKNRLRAGFREFGSTMHGFICPEAVLIAVESRTSSPVRILRDPETLESSSLPGLWPAGEGSGYAGGIISSAMDGERCASAIIRVSQER